MSSTIRHKYKYFHSTVQGAKDRRQKFHFCRLPSDVRPCNVKLNLSNLYYKMLIPLLSDFGSFCFSFRTIALCPGLFFIRVLPSKRRFRTKGVSSLSLDVLLHFILRRWCRSRDNNRLPLAPVNNLLYHVL